MILINLMDIGRYLASGCSLEYFKGSFENYLQLNFKTKTE